MLASSGEKDAALGSAGHRPSVQALFGEDPGFQERLHQGKDALVPDPTSHPVHKGRVRNLVEARFDVRLEHPLVGAGGDVVDLSDGVLRPALRTEAVAARLEVRLVDWLEYQLQRGLHDAVGGGGYPRPGEP